MAQLQDPLERIAHSFYPAYKQYNITCFLAQRSQPHIFLDCKMCVHNLSLSSQTTLAQLQYNKRVVDYKMIRRLNILKFELLKTLAVTSYSVNG